MLAPGHRRPPGLAHWNDGPSPPSGSWGRFSFRYQRPGAFVATNPDDSRRLPFESSDCIFGSQPLGCWWRRCPAAVRASKDGNGRRLSGFKLSAGRRRLARWNDGPSPSPRWGRFIPKRKARQTCRAVQEYFTAPKCVFRPCCNEYCRRAESRRLNLGLRARSRNSARRRSAARSRGASGADDARHCRDPGSHRHCRDATGRLRPE
jgi:hypothetical protein